MSSLVHGQSTEGMRDEHGSRKLDQLSRSVAIGRDKNIELHGRTQHFRPIPGQFKVGLFYLAPSAEYSQTFKQCRIFD